MYRGLPVLPVLWTALLPAWFATAQVTRTDSAFDLSDGSDASVLEIDDAVFGAISRDFSFEDDLRNGGDVSLVGIWTAREVTFGIPDYWELDGVPVLHLDVIRSAQLIPEVSAITVWADGRPVGTFMLDGEPGEVVEHELPLPLASDTGYHTLTFVAYHRSLLPCELSDHPGLWSRILGSSYIRVQYRPDEPELSLARWPYPFRDDRDPDPARIVLVMPEHPATEEVLAAGYIASTLAHSASWLPMDLIVHQGGIQDAPAGHVIAVVRADGNSAALTELKSVLAASDIPEVAALGSALRTGKVPKAGALAVLPRPGTPSRALLAVAGKDRAGLEQLAILLAGEESSGLPSGPVELVDAVQAPRPMDERRWEDTVPPEESFTLAELGMSDVMAAGYRGGSIAIPLKLVPDAHPVPGSARLELKYSYSAQVSTERSRLDVLVNDAAAGGTALTDADGRNRQTMLLDLPVHEMGPESTVYVRFSLVGQEEPICLGETHEELWGTVHSDTRITLPRDHWAPIPDLSMLRFGGYPFGLRSDLSDTLFVLPAKPGESDLQLFVWIAAELGRVARGDRFAYDVRLGDVDPKVDGEKDIVVVDTGAQAKVIEQLGLLEDMSFTVRKPVGVGMALASGGEVALGADPDVSYIEEMRLPWNRDRAALVAYAVDPTLFQRVGPCLDGSPLFDRLEGRVARIASCSDLAVIPVEEIEMLGQRPVRDSAYGPVRRYYWPVLLGLLLLAMVAILLIKQWKLRRAEQAYHDDLD